MSCKSNFSILISGHVQNINAFTVASHDWPTCDPHFLYLLASSKQHSILRLPSYFYIDSMQKCEHQVTVKVKEFFFEVKTVSYSLVSYFLLLCTWLWTECVCLCIWNISLVLLTCFCSWVLQLAKGRGTWFLTQM